jgi:predicted small secreted protein
MKTRQSTGIGRLVAVSLALAIALPLAACATDKGAGIKVKTLVDPKANISGYKSYAWAEQDNALKDPNQAWVPLNFDINQELQFLTDQELRQRGFQFAAENAEPDLYASFLVVVNMEAQAEAIKKRYGETADLKNLHEGGLVIALIDPETDRAVWAGTATGQVKTDRTDAQAKELLTEAVHKIFETFPAEEK